MKKNFLVVSAIAVVFVFGLIAYISFFAAAKPSITKPIGELIPENVAGWESKDLPMAETESMNERVNKILQFDQSVYRVYKNGSSEVIIYVAYWEPGKVTTTDAGVHNPDSCWLNSGWTRLDRKYGVRASLGMRKLTPFEYGVYQNKDSEGKEFALPVIFWHLVAGEPNRYEAQREGWRDGLAGRIDRLPLYLADIKKNGLNLRREQMFIRITANKSFDVLFKDSEFIRLMEALEPLGIFENENKETAPAPAK